MTGTPAHYPSDLTDTQRQLIDMKRFRNVLLIADRHEQSNAFFDWAVTFIKTNRVRLTVLDVLPKIPPPEMLMQQGAFNPQELQESVVNQRLMELRQWITPFQARRQGAAGNSLSGDYSGGIA